MTDTNNNQQAFEKSLGNYIEKAIANNPSLLRMRRLHQVLVTEVRRRLKEGMVIHPIGAVSDESGKVSFIETEKDIDADALMLRLKKVAMEGKVFAASLCTMVERASAAGGKPALFIQMHTEDKSGLAIVAGIPADEKENTEGWAGVRGPAVAVSGYKKKVSPIIFVAA